MKRTRTRRFPTAAIAMCVLASSLSHNGVAEETTAESSPSTDQHSEADQLIEQLASSSFIERDWAARRLMSRGASIVPQLETAVRNDLASDPVLALLTRMSKSMDADTSVSALRAIASLRENPKPLSAEARESVERAYRNSLRSSLASLTLWGAVITRDERLNVTALQLRSDDFDDHRLRWLSPLTNLHTLDLRNTRITDAGLKHLAPLTNLVRLNLSDTHVTSSGLRELTALPNLKQVIAYRIEVTPADDAWLHEQLPGITLTTR